jgi:hypothetical protein
VKRRPLGTANHRIRAGIRRAADPIGATRARKLSSSTTLQMFGSTTSPRLRRNESATRDGSELIPICILRTASGVLVNTLLDWGVEVIFGLPGDGINGIVEGLRTRQDRSG